MIKIYKPQEEEIQCKVCDKCGGVNSHRADCENGELPLSKVWNPCSCGAIPFIQKYAQKWIVMCRDCVTHPASVAPGLWEAVDAWNAAHPIPVAPKPRSIGAVLAETDNAEARGTGDSIYDADVKWMRETIDRLVCGRMMEAWVFNDVIKPLTMTALARGRTSPGTGGMTATETQPRFCGEWLVWKAEDMAGVENNEVFTVINALGNKCQWDGKSLRIGGASYWLRLYPQPPPPAAPPCCKDWAENIEKVNAGFALQAARSGNPNQYQSKQFTHCPWCGKPIRQ